MLQIRPLKNGENALFRPIAPYWCMRITQIILGENDIFLQGREASAKPDDKQITITHIVPEKFRVDVKALTNYVGEVGFKSGLSIEVSLNELLSVVPRQRKRTDAYDTLVKYLKDELNITLTIKNNRQ